MGGCFFVFMWKSRGLAGWLAFSSEKQALPDLQGRQPRVYKRSMAVKLGTCPHCIHPIYREEGVPDACDCDEGVWETLRLREPTPAARTASQKMPNMNGDVLPDLDITMFMSASARAEMEGARGFRASRGAEPFDKADQELNAYEEATIWNTSADVEASGLDFEFSTGDDIDLPQAAADRPGRYRVDRGAPEPSPWARTVASGPSDGRVVGRVGQGVGRPQRARPEPVYEIGREEPVEWLPARAPAQESRVVAVTSREGTRPLVSRPTPAAKVPTAYERLGSIEIGDDPFK